MCPAARGRCRGLRRTSCWEGQATDDSKEGQQVKTLAMTRRGYRHNNRNQQTGEDTGSLRTGRGRTSGSGRTGTHYGPHLCRRSGGRLPSARRRRLGRLALVGIRESFRLDLAAAAAEDGLGGRLGGGGVRRLTAVHPSPLTGRLRLQRTHPHRGVSGPKPSDGAGSAQRQTQEPAKGLRSSFWCETSQPDVKAGSGAQCWHNYTSSTAL